VTDKIDADLQVFVHDPLYLWGITAGKVKKWSKGDTATVRPAPNMKAERAVGRVNTKLRGLDWGESEPLSVEGQVEQLLQEAMDPARLSRHYVGWSAWC
jgi:serine-protein kinase ATM